ncbi:hypothetical protein [Methanohalobium sp.]|uniref:hypothetical protein n=1 Tax=Methanohalobium sp. TaxID=2837493 RepID=UPI0025D35A84|nr:hypothetical protein [Methanohalobium sp.]
MLQKVSIVSVLFLLAMSVFVGGAVGQATDYDWTNPCEMDCNQSNFSNPDIGFQENSVINSSVYWTSGQINNEYSIDKVVVWVSSNEEVTVTVTNSDTNTTLNKTTVADTTGEPIALDVRTFDTITVDVVSDGATVTGVGIYSIAPNENTINLQGTVEPNLNPTQDVPSPRKNSVQNEDTSSENDSGANILGKLLIYALLFVGGLFVIVILLVIVSKVTK